MKDPVCDAIGPEINESGIIVERTPKQVLNKIDHIQKCFKRAHDFATSETGEGLKENDPATFQEKVEQKCPWYDDLLPVMADRASAKPRCTNDDLSIDSDQFLPSEEDTDDSDKLSVASSTLGTPQPSEKKW